MSAVQTEREQRIQRARTHAEAAQPALLPALALERRATAAPHARELEGRRMNCCDYDCTGAPGCPATSASVCDAQGVCMNRWSTCQGACIGPDTWSTPKDPDPSVEDATDLLHIAAVLALVGLCVMLGSLIAGYAWGRLS